MANINLKAQEIVKDEETFQCSTDHQNKFFRSNYSRYRFYREGEITALDVLYGRLVLDEDQYKKSLTPEEHKKVLDEERSWRQVIGWHLSPPQLNEGLSYVRIASLFGPEKAPAHCDYLLLNTAFAIAFDLDNIVGSTIQQFRSNTDRAIEVITEIFEEEHNYAKVDGLIWCYERMVKRIREVKGW